MNATKRKKIFYIPGLFSLMVIPVLFIHFAKQHINAVTFTSIPLFLADQNLPKKYPGLLSWYKGEFPPKRIYTDIVFTENEHANVVKLAFAKIRIREILADQDTLNGVQFHFSDSSPYGIFVKSVDILRQEEAKLYLPIGNDIWFSHLPPDTKEMVFICGTSLYSRHYIFPEIGGWEHIKKEILHIWNASWQIIWGFIVFVFALFILPLRRNTV